MNNHHIVSALAVMVAITMTGCASYTVQPTPKLDPTAYAQHAQVQGVYVAAKAYDTAKSCRSVFNDNLTSRGYVPVQVAIENKNSSPLIVYRSDMQLMLSNGQKLNPVSSKIVVGHFQNSVVGGALLTGVFGVAAAEDANRKRAATFKEKAFPAEIPLAPGQVKTGFLYFKVNPDEMASVSLQVQITVNGKSQMVKVPV